VMPPTPHRVEGGMGVDIEVGTSKTGLNFEISNSVLRRGIWTKRSCVIMVRL